MTRLNRAGVGTNPCHVDLFSLFPGAWLSLGNSYLVGSLKRLDELLNSSLSSFLCLSCLKLSLNYITFTHTPLLNPHRWHFLSWKCITHFSDLAAGWPPTKEINLVTEPGKKGAWRCSFQCFLVDIPIRPYKELFLSILRKKQENIKFLKSLLKLKPLGA